MKTEIILVNMTFDLKVEKLGQAGFCLAEIISWG